MGREVVFYEDAEPREIPDGFTVQDRHFVDLDEVVPVTVLPDGTQDGGETQEERFRNKVLTDLTTALGPNGGWRPDMIARVKEALGMPLTAEENAVIAEPPTDASYAAYLARVKPRVEALQGRWKNEGLID